jgi:hypothetical protein
LFIDDKNTYTDIVFEVCMGKCVNARLSLKNPVDAEIPKEAKKGFNSVSF